MANPNPNLLLSDGFVLQVSLAELRELAESRGWRMPSDKELIASGRLDLRYALQRADREHVALLAGLKVNHRGRPRKPTG